MSKENQKKRRPPYLTALCTTQHDDLVRKPVDPMNTDFEHSLDVNLHTVPLHVEQRFCTFEQIL